MENILVKLMDLINEHRDITVSMYGDGQICVTGTIELIRSEDQNIEIEGENFYISIPINFEPIFYEDGIEFFRNNIKMLSLLF